MLYPPSRTVSPWPSSHQRATAHLFAAGPDIRENVVVERGNLIDEAPTYAAILGVEMPWAQGTAMTEILKHENGGNDSGIIGWMRFRESAGTKDTAEAASSQKGTQAQAESGEKVNIEFWHCMGSSNGELIQEIADSFNASQDEVVVKAVHQGSYTDAGTKMQAALAAGKLRCWPRWKSACWESLQMQTSLWIYKSSWMRKGMI